MILSKKKINKKIKNGKIKEYINNKIEENYEDFLSDFLTLTKSNGWFWYDTEINYDTLLEHLTTRVVDIINSEYNSSNTGRILIDKHPDDTFPDDMDIDISISY